MQSGLMKQITHTFHVGTVIQSVFTIFSIINEPQSRFVGTIWKNLL